MSSVHQSPPSSLRSRSLLVIYGHCMCAGILNREKMKQWSKIFKSLKTLSSCSFLSILFIIASSSLKQLLTTFIKFVICFINSHFLCVCLSFFLLQFVRRPFSSSFVLPLPPSGFFVLFSRDQQRVNGKKNHKKSFFFLDFFMDFNSVEVVTVLVVFLLFPGILYTGEKGKNIHVPIKSVRDCFNPSTRRCTPARGTGGWGDHGRVWDGDLFMWNKVINGNERDQGREREKSELLICRLSMVDCVFIFGVQITLKFLRDPKRRKNLNPRRLTVLVERRASKETDLDRCLHGPKKWRE